MKYLTPVDYDLARITEGKVESGSLTATYLRALPIRSSIRFKTVILLCAGADPKKNFTKGISDRERQWG
jgi:hypothetical protein